jgi:60 kDa SS-A/Ro ribonucleoprotein
MSYLKRHARVPQWAPLRDQVANSEGRYVWAVDDWTRLRRFLILGSEGGSFYASDWKLTCENAEAVERAIQADGPRAVAEIVAVSRAGRAPKNDPALCAPAMAAGRGDEETPKAALAALPQVAGKGTHVFQFASGMTSNGFSIADPADPGMLDVVGFDAATSQLISDFARGAL